MGIDVTCSCGKHVLRMGYGGFFNLRSVVVTALGYNYEAMVLRGGNKTEEVRCKKENPGLHAFLATKDTDDTWTTEECQLILPALQDYIDVAEEAEKKGKEDAANMPPAVKLAAVKRLLQNFDVRCKVQDLIEGLEHCIEEEHGMVIG